MRLELKEMRIVNFKGINDLAINFNADSTLISGKNGTGKTSISDAFMWVLFNKDSRGNAPGSDKFREKPLDADGREVHNLVTEVELICNLDGKAFNLKREQEENWVKKRGNLEATFQGNVSRYWINGVDVKVSEFNNRISEIAGEDAFRMIGVLGAFNALDWRKRRELLLGMTGVDVDRELLAMEDFAEINELITERNVSVDDLKKVLADERRKLNDDLKMIPVRVDEAKKALPSFEAGQVEAAEGIVAEGEGYISEIEEKIRIAMAEKDQGAGLRIVTLQSEMESIRRMTDDRWRSEKELAQRIKTNASMRLDDAVKAQDRLNTESGLMVKRIYDAEKKLSDLRDDYKQEYEKKLVSVVEEVCPTCDQAIPQERLEGTRQAERAQFDQKRAEKLAEIKGEGVRLGQELDGLKAQLKEIEDRQSALSMEISATRREAEAADEEYKKFSEGSVVYPDRVLEIANELEELSKVKDAGSRDAKINTLKAERDRVRASMESARVIISRHQSGIETEKRVDQLVEMQKEKGIKMAECEKQIFDVEAFIQKRSERLEDSVNAFFESVKWKLFDRHISGGLIETCQCMVLCDGGYVPYETANTAAAINADVEIINVLSDRNGLQLPLFVDNAERINKIKDTKSQLIALSVSDSDQLIVA